jgi:hypothetical protein
MKDSPFAIHPHERGEFTLSEMFQLTDAWEQGGRTSEGFMEILSNRYPWMLWSAQDILDTRGRTARSSEVPLT